jgi:O-antigen/teichoic acid export membrane protein
LTDRRRLFKQIGAVSLIGMLAQLAFLAASFVLQHRLSPGDFGRADLANKVINLAGYLGLVGVNTAIIRAMPRRDLGRYDWPALLPRVAATAGGVALLAAGLTVVQYGFPWWHGAVIAVSALGLSLAVASAAVLAIDLRFAASQWAQQLWRPVLLAGILAALAGGFLTLDVVLVLYAAAGILALLLVALALEPVPRGREALPLGRLVREGALFFGLFLTSSLMLRLDAFFLAGLISVEALGRYAAAANIALTGYGILAAGVAQVVTPRIASGEGLRLKGLLLTLTLLAVAGGVVIVLLGTPFIHWVSGDKYPGDFAPLLVLLCLAGIVQVAYVVPSAWLGAVAPEPALRLFLAVNVVSLGINVVLNSLLIPRWQLEGAALATALSWLWRLGWAIAFVAWIRRVRDARRGRPPDAAATGADIMPRGDIA